MPKKATVIVNQRMREMIECDRLKRMDFQTIDQLIEWISLFLLEFHTEFDWSVWTKKKETQTFQDDPTNKPMITEPEHEHEDEERESLKSFVIGNALKKWVSLSDETVVREKTEKSLLDLLDCMLRPLEDAGETMDDGSVTDSLLFAEIVGSLEVNLLLWPHEQLDSMSLDSDQWNVAVDSIFKAILAVSSRSFPHICHLLSLFVSPAFHLPSDS